MAEVRVSIGSLEDIVVYDDADTYSDGVTLMKAFLTRGAGTADHEVDHATINDGVTFAEGADLDFGTSTGSKIGTSASQKIGFWNATPIVQPASANQAALALDTDVTGGDTVDLTALNASLVAIQTLVNQLRSDLVAAGLIKGSA